MHMEDLEVRKVIQIIPSTGLWLRKAVVRGEPLTSAEFEPVLAIALVEVSAHDQLFLSEGLLPIGSGEMMWGLVERFPLEGLRVDPASCRIDGGDIEAGGHARLRSCRGKQRLAKSVASPLSRFGRGTAEEQ
jgi:hypothetical protein